MPLRASLSELRPSRAQDRKGHKGVSMRPSNITERVYDFITVDDEGRTCEAIPESACRQAPRNFVFNVMNGSATKLAEQLASPGLVLPWLLAARATIGGLLTLIAGILLRSQIADTQSIEPYLVLIAGAAVLWGIGGLYFAAIDERSGATQGGRNALSEVSAGLRLGRKTYLVDGAPSDERPLYVAVSNTLMGVVTLFGGSLGLVAHFLGTRALILLLIVLALFAAGICRTLPEAGEMKG